MYKHNTDVYRCIEEKIQTSMRKGYELQRVNSTDGKRKTTTDEKFTQALGDIDEMKTKIILNLELFSDVFIRRVRNVRGVLRYEVLDTREVTIITDSDLKPIRYTYRRKSPGTLRMESYLAEDVEHFKSGHNFDNPLFGFTPLSTLIYDALGDDEARKVQYYWYLNDAVPSSLFVLAEGLGSNEKEDAITGIQATLKGSHNKGKSMITDAVKDIKPISVPTSSADDIERRKYNTEKICAGLGVPRSVLGYIEDVNYSNGDIQLKKFIENTIQPLERVLEKIFTKLSQDFSGFQFVINSEHIDQLEQLSRVARENVNSGLWTRNEAREYLGWDKVLDELADELTVPSSMQLLDNLLLGEPTEPTPLDKDGNPVKL